MTVLNESWNWQKGMQICLEVELPGDDAQPPRTTDDVDFPLF